MAKIKINFPEKHLFETKIEVRISDVNYGGHLGNDAILSLVHEARIRYLNSLGYSEKNIEGKAIIMSDATIVFRSEGFYGDKLLISVAAEGISNTGFDLLYKILRISDNKEIARVKTGIVFFDYNIKRIASIPEIFKFKLLSNI